MRQRANILLFACTCLLAPATWTSADAPPGRYVLPGDGTVFDARTGLTWQQVTMTNAFTQAAASTICTNLSLPGTGWRLPSVSELLTLVDPTRYDPAIDPEGFPGTSATFFWTSSPYVRNVGEVWFVDFGNGDTSNHRGDDSSIIARVRCVR